MKVGNLKVYGVIYKITNDVNGKVYIGQTTNEKGIRGRYGIGSTLNIIKGIYRYHNTSKRNGYSYNNHLINSIDLYGSKNFTVVEVFDIAFSKIELDLKEDMWIKYYNSIKNGYNNKEGGSFGKVSEESIKKKIETNIKRGQTRKVYQMTVPDLEIIKEFSSISSATRELGLSRSSIKNVLNPNYSSLTAGGYAWRYKNEENTKYQDSSVFDEDLRKEKRVSSRTKGEKTKKELTIELFNEGKTVEEISNILKTNKKIIRLYVTNANLVEVVKTSKKLDDAEQKRRIVIGLYIKGFKPKKIEEITGLSNSIISKAIYKYRQGVINSDGVYI